jgi:K(+)-stimulated pyrophosphate-energized sodium pump
MLPETMKMDFFGEGTKEISSMRVFYAIVGLSLVQLFHRLRNITGLGTKPVMAIVQNRVRGEEPM